MINKNLCHIILTFVLIFIVEGMAYGQSCDCEVSEDKEEAYNALLQLNVTEREESESTHLPWGVPKNPASATNEHLLYQNHYIINYDDDLRVPIWVAYRLRVQEVNIHRVRTECFRRDIRLGDEDASFCKDYEELIYDRGHLVPNADMTRSEAAMINTYILSNIAPQHDEFNRVIWKRLERYVRKWAMSKEEIYVITGAVFDKNGDGKRDADSDADLMEPLKYVAVPTHFYKIILHERPNGLIESMVFLLPHEDISHADPGANTYLEEHLTAIDTIESLTGIDFLPGLGMSNTNKEKAVESFQATRMWPRDS